MKRKIICIGIITILLITGFSVVSAKNQVFNESNETNAEPSVDNNKILVKATVKDKNGVLMKGESVYFRWLDGPRFRTGGNSVSQTGYFTGSPASSLKAFEAGDAVRAYALAQGEFGQETSKWPKNIGPNTEYINGKLYYIIQESDLLFNSKNIALSFETVEVTATQNKCNILAHFPIFQQILQRIPALQQLL